MKKNENEDQESAKNEEAKPSSVPLLLLPAPSTSGDEDEKILTSSGSNISENEEESISDSTIVDNETTDKEQSKSREVSPRGEDSSKEEPFVPPEIAEFLQCEESTVQSINEAIELYEQIAYSNPQEFLIFYNNTRATRVRMLVEYLIPQKGGDELSIVNEIVNPKEMYYLPESAKFIQVHFEYSKVGIIWDHICSYQDFSHTFAYSKPATRRYFVVGYGDEIHISQIRDEYEQLVLE